MAKYPVINKITGEQKEVEMSVLDWDAWKDDNPDWQRDWSDPDTCPGTGEVGREGSIMATFPDPSKR